MVNPAEELRRQRISESMKKIKHNGQFQKGCTPWNKGIPHSEETKKKIMNVWILPDCDFSIGEFFTKVFDVCEFCIDYFVDSALDCFVVN